MSAPVRPLDFLLCATPALAAAPPAAAARPLPEPEEPAPAYLIAGRLVIPPRPARDAGAR